MRYIVEQTIDEKEFKFTHIEEKENLDGEIIEVIKGRNVINVDNLIKALEEMKEERENQFKILDDNIKTAEAMLKAIEDVK